MSPSARASEIKSAFRRLAFRYHPDKNQSQEAKALFQEISEAYDILGDPEKRAQYDARLANPFSDLLSEPVRRHRDPAYHRKRQGAPRAKEPPASYLMMRDSLKYTIWISRIGLLASVLFFVDYLLPFRETEEKISDISAVAFSRSIAYHLVVLESGHRIKLYHYSAGGFTDGMNIRMTTTLLYRTVISVSNRSGTHVVNLAYMYRDLVFLPILLFVNSVLAIIFRKRVELCFNLNLAGLMWLVINLILI